MKVSGYEIMPPLWRLNSGIRRSNGINWTVHRAWLEVNHDESKRIVFTYIGSYLIASEAKQDCTTSGSSTIRLKGTL